jgi:hypothetical protein
MYILNFDRVIELEKAYRDSDIASSSFHNMVSVMSNNEDTPESGVIINTLIHLGVLIGKK